MAEATRENDLVLAPNEFAFISDQTKGNINVYVGPYKTSLANTDQPAMFNERTKRFERCNLEQSTQIFSTAPEGWYLVVKNPSRDGAQPKTGTVNNLPELDIGHKINVPGPVSFSLWPGQMVRVVPGHQLHSNQYLLVRVYDEEAAKKNWRKAVIKLHTPAHSEPPTPDSDSVLNPDTETPDLTMGKLLVIKGTEVSFYIPPTGVEVVRDDNNQYVREAVTLERLEYCILLDEDGNKRFIQGPAVVFPKPTEKFVERNRSRKFKAIELNAISGLYVKVIAPYQENGKDYKVGDELFITGQEQMIYFPRPEHAIIKYGDREINHAIAIPAGEGRYVLNRLTGHISLQRGPRMFLPDPRVEVIIRRVLEPHVVGLWFPGNQEALEYNRRLKQLTDGKGAGAYVTSSDLEEAPAAPAPAKAAEEAAPGFAGDDFNRKQKYTPPRTITLNTKYEGAVSIVLWTGYAVLVVSKTGERKVITGPQTILLEYEEGLESMTLSTGTPKTDEKLYKTVYLRVLHNKVSDSVEAETADLCQVHVNVSYRVNFEGAPERWFNVENYVKFLSDHMRSVIRNAVKKHGIEQFYSNSINIIRDTVLGTVGEDGKRTGRLFEENGMRIYDVEVLDVKIGDQTIAGLLVQAQHDVVQQTLDISSEKRKLDFVQQHELIQRQINEAQSSSRQQELELKAEEIRKDLMVNLAQLQSSLDLERRRLDARMADQEVMSQIQSAELQRKKATSDQDLAVAQAQLQQRLAELQAEVEAVVSKATAVSPDLIAAMQAFGDRALAEKMAETMAPLAILGGESIVDVFSRLLKGTKLERFLMDTPHPQ